MSTNAASLAPETDYAMENEYPEAPWLDLMKITYCNCSNHPNIGKIAINRQQLPGIENEDIAVSNSNENKPTQNQNFAERVELRGTCYHPDFQVNLRRLKHDFIMQDKETEIRLRFESDNEKDRNAVIAEALLQNHWKMVGYIPKFKLKKVHSAMKHHELHSVQLINIAYTFYETHNKHYYIPTISLLKSGRWLRNDYNYKYNDDINA